MNIAINVGLSYLKELELKGKLSSHFSNVIFSSRDTVFNYKPRQ